MLIEHIEPLRSAMRLTRRRYPFALDSSWYLPDHLQVVMTLQKRTQTLYSVEFDQTPVPRRVRPESRRSPVQGEVALWQRLSEHTIRDDRDFERHVDYIHYNPVTSMA